MITQAELKTLLTYDPNTGVFKWAVGQPGRRLNSVAGSVSAKGYRVLRVNYVQYRAARLAWLYMTGNWPFVVDHFNGDTLDDSFANLRNVSPLLNTQNRHKANSNSLSGLIGALKSHKGWRARIHINGKRVDLGTYSTPEKAHEVYMQAKRLNHHTSAVGV